MQLADSCSSAQQPSYVAMPPPVSQVTECDNNNADPDPGGGIVVDDGDGKHETVIDMTSAAISDSDVDSPASVGVIDIPASSESIDRSSRQSVTVTSLWLRMHVHPADELLMQQCADTHSHSHSTRDAFTSRLLAALIGRDVHGHAEQQHFDQQPDAAIGTVTAAAADDDGAGAVAGETNGEGESASESRRRSRDGDGDGGGDVTGRELIDLLMRAIHLVEEDQRRVEAGLASLIDLNQVEPCTCRRDVLMCMFDFGSALERNSSIPAEHWYKFDSFVWSWITKRLDDVQHHDANGDEPHKRYDATRKDKYGHTALMRVCQYYWYNDAPLLHVCDRLLQLGADVNLTLSLPGRYHGWTALLLQAACNPSNASALKLLLRHGADPNARTERGQTFIQLLVETLNVKAIRQLYTDKDSAIRRSMRDMDYSIQARYHNPRHGRVWRTPLGLAIRMLSVAQTESSKKKLKEIIWYIGAAQMQRVLWRLFLIVLIYTMLRLVFCRVLDVNWSWTPPSVQYGSLLRIVMTLYAEE